MMHAFSEDSLSPMLGMGSYVKLVRRLLEESWTLLVRIKYHTTGL